MKTLHIISSILALATVANAHTHSQEQEQDMQPSRLIPQNVTQTPEPWGHHHLHGVPILDTELSLQQKLYWEAYNTTTYLTLESSHQHLLFSHISLLLLSCFLIYPLLLVFNNINSSYLLPLNYVNVLITTLACILYSVYINNVPELFPNMAYSKLVTGLLFFSIIQTALTTLYSLSKYLSHSNYSKLPGLNIHLDDLNSPNPNSSSPASTLYEDDGDEDARELVDANGNGLNFDINNEDDMDAHFHSSIKTPIVQSPPSTSTQNLLIKKLSSYNSISSFATTFSSLFNILHNISVWGLLVYYFVMLPTGVACLNLMGQSTRIFNLLAHFIKGEVFIIIGIISLARYCGCFAGIGGAWNTAFVDFNHHQDLINPPSNSGIQGVGSGGHNIMNSTFIKLHKLVYGAKNSGLICSFEGIESFLIFFYGSTNIFLEHLASKDGVWTAKDLQHVSIAFMYLGAGLCGLIAEHKLSDWRRSLYSKLTKQSTLNNDASHKLVTPGFSPNPFPVFTIFWTGLLMSKHAQASQLSTDIHVQWGSLLTYGSFFRVFTFLLMSYSPFKESIQCYLPSKPLTELITSFCLICGGLVFMESTDQVIEALAYRGLTPMFTINVSVGVVSLFMAWIMVLFAIKDRLKN
ncbi:hypothetical protein CAS74_003209 [Pichia kudriavzevii]|uniref:Protein YTP1 n=1 Tax=Pichia kudriavzevii TaxID=4909 RepID=A0A1Z8JNQ7_PICKU|nr:hypothetical protein CAS74_003209 [Pichia kudriavzevii]